MAEFATIAAGYAKSRPAVHPQVLERVREHLRLTERLDRALDVGCGAGLSTKPLQSVARHCLGIDPSEAMLQWSPQIAPGASFAVGRAEALPVRSRSTDLLTAAGSLNYADLSLFFPEAVRVLRPDGVVAIYDFSPGRRLRGSAGLDEWYSEFLLRYPAPSDWGHPIDLDFLQSFDSGLRLTDHQLFEIGVTLDPSFYIDYVMTETNVARAVQAGTSEDEIRAWCTETLAAVFQDEEREVLFEGYIAYLAG